MIGLKVTKKVLLAENMKLKKQLKDLKNRDRNKLKREKEDAYYLEFLNKKLEIINKHRHDYDPSKINAKIRKLREKYFS